MTENLTSEEYFEEQKKDLKKTASAQQRRAANPANSVWVEASAGTGKTKVLSDRVLRLLLAGVKPIRLLCLTYTKAAAAEMRSRISERLSGWAVETEEDLDKHLAELLGDEFCSAANRKHYRDKARTLFAELLDTPGGIKIQTIHGFCTDILKRFPLEAGISPYFTVLEDDESKMALNQIKNAVVQAENYADDEETAAANRYLIENVSEYTYDKMIGNIVGARHEMAVIMEKHGGIRGFLTELAAKLGVKDSDTDESIKAEFMEIMRSQEKEIRANIAALKVGGGKWDTDKVDVLEAMLAHGYDIQYYEGYKDCLLNTGNKAYTDVKRYASQTACNFDANLLERLMADAFLLEKFEVKRQKSKLYHSTKAAFILASDINRRYDEYKVAKSCVDFDDLINYTCNLLENSAARQWVLYKLDGGIDHILVDEAQDTSPKQWEIVDKISEEFFSGIGQKEANRTIFVVGDRKQSIFSFQGADPVKFDKMSGTFKSKVEASGQIFDNVNLEVSFRSAPKILEVVNQIFAQGPATEGVVDEKQGKKVDHKPYRVGQYAKVTIMPLLEPEKGEKTQKGNEYNRAPTERVYKIATVTRMAEAVAQRIREMIDASQKDEKPLRYRDIMVLVAKRGEFVPEFIRACEKKRVAISGADKMLLSQQIAVQDLISLGKFLLFPQDDLSLAEALTSPLFSIEEKLLEDACWERKDRSLWEVLQEKDNQQAHIICSQLQTLLKNLDYIRPYELFNYVLSDLGKRRKFVERMGQEVEDALDEFINMTLDYEQREIPTLQGFISWFEQNEREIKRDSDDSEIDAVRLLTVHHSKGLQAPVVFLPCAGIMPKTDREQAFLCDGNLGYYPLNKDYYEETCSNIHAQNVEKSMREYHRLLYVALTRAEDQLIIGAYGKRNAQSWYELCRQTFDGDEPSVEDIEMISEKYVEKEEKKKSLLVQKAYNYEPWLDENITGAENNLLKPYTPSKADDDEELPDSSSPLADNEQFYRRGTLIHRLLQFLPQNNGDKEKAIDLFLQKYATEFSAPDIRQIKDEVLRLLNSPEFADIFGAYSRPEVPIMGAVNGKIISAQIDRLVVMPDKIKIVDFKTNRPPAKDVAHTSPQYIKQLAAYAELIRRIYPNKPIETYILWTNETRLMQVA